MSSISHRPPTIRASRRRLTLGLTAVGILVVLGVLVLGYATNRGGRSSHAVSAAAGSPPGRASGPALSVPDFAVSAAPFVGGQRFVLSQHTEKPTVVFFMASWCVSCVPEARAIAQLQGEMGQQVNFVILDIDLGDNLIGLEHFWKAAFSPANLWALDQGSQVSSAYHVNSLDTTIVIAGGKEVSRTIGSRSLSQLKETLAAAGVPR